MFPSTPLTDLSTGLSRNFLRSLFLRSLFLRSLAGSPRRVLNVAKLRSLRARCVTLSLLAMVLAFASKPAAAQTPALTFQVNSTADLVDQTPGDGKCATGNFINSSTTPQCTLRAAIDEANALSTSNPSSLYAITLPSGTYSLTTNESCTLDSFVFTTISLCLTGNIVINGPASGSPAVIDAGGTGKAMRIPQGAVVQLTNLTIQNGYDSGGFAGGGGAGIHSEATLTVSHCLFTKNDSTVGTGSAIYNGGISLTVEGSTFEGNTGSVLYLYNGATTVIGQSYFTGNQAENGVAILSQNPGNLTISNSTFTQNQSTTLASSDYVISLNGGNPTLTMTNSTVSFNTVSNADILYTTGTAVLNNDTIYGNTMTSGYSVDVATSLSVSNSILYDTGGSSLCSSFTDLGHNFIGSEALCFGTPAPSPTTQVGVDPKMGAIILDGGSVPVQLPLPGSPVIGAGSTSTPGANASGACAALDENGKPRGLSSTCTVGAAEPLVGLQMNNIVPAQGGSGGNVTMAITGFGFDPSSTVALHRSGQTNIAPKIFSISADGTTFSAGLSLVGAALGAYDVVLTTSTSSVTLPAAFTVATATAPMLQSFISGPPALRANRPGTFELTYTNNGNTDAYLVPLYLNFPNGFTGTIKGVQSPPANSQQVLTDYSTDSLGLASAPGTANPPVNIALLLPVVPAGTKNTLTFTMLAVGNPGTPFTFYQHLGTPYSSNPDTGAADTSAINAIVSYAVADDTANLGVTPSAAAQSAMSTYANSQLIATLDAGETALLQSFGAAPVVYSFPQLLDDVGAYGAAYKAPQPMGVRPFYIPGLSDNPPAGGCGGSPMAPGSSCKGSYTPFPGGPPDDGCTGDCGGGAASGGTTIGSEDPNLKSGPLGAGTAHYTQANSPFPYLIEFENDATASAAAQTVSVTDNIDTTKLDLSTFQFGPISFGAAPYVLNPPAGVTSFQGSIDLRPGQDIIVYITAGLNTSSGVITWNFTSLDPATMQLTTDPTAGFLPPDTTPPAGIGHVAFTMTPLASVADASQICNTAVVVFDTNSPISTAPYCNTKDISAPTSMVQALAAIQMTTAFPVTWSGMDTGSGVGTYTIYSNLDGGAFTPWLTATPATTATFTGVPGHTYGFYSIATDQAGNVEAAKSQAEATTFIGVAAGSFSPSTVTFPATAMGNTSSAAVTLTSNGAMPLNVTGFTLSDPTDFSETDTCVAASPIAVGQSCTVTVTFTPGTSTSLTAPVTATLSATSNAPTAPTPVALSATVSLPQSVWLADTDGTLAIFANTGANATPTAGLSGGGSGIAIDNAGNVWSGATGGTSVVEFNASGTLLGNWSGAGISSPTALAISGSGNVWIANANNTLSLLNADGSAVSSSSGLTGEPLNTPSSVAIDASGSVWVANSGDSSLTQFLGAADPVVTPLANAVKTATLGARP
jgi:CSLREA domain-containing protein